VAEATSLLAIVPVAIVGAISHDRNGNVRRQDGVLVGLFALGGAAAGVAVANALSGTALRIAFSVLLVFVAAQLARDAMRRPPEHDPPMGASASRR